MRGGWKHRRLVNETIDRLVEEGYHDINVERYLGGRFVDILAVRDGRRLVAECGWLSEENRFKKLQDYADDFMYVGYSGVVITFTKETLPKCFKSYYSKGRERIFGYSDETEERKLPRWWFAAEESREEVERLFGGKRRT
jgi:hypothetical protein